ncbi:MAG: cytidylate kinase-like family protein [Firmicutes bacterium]|nr:cytidylate kinase-like family protein [Bacillota bacterium]
MAKSIIITVGREYGSGGREIAEKVAKELGIPYYDKELITRASEESGIQKGLFEKADEKASHGAMFSMGWSQAVYPGNYMYYNNDMLTNDSLFSMQAETIRRIAAEGSAVIVGRCADYLLDGNPNLLKVFIHADLSFRKRRIMRLYDVPENQVEGVIKRTDRQRAKYYEFYTAQNWGEAKNYDISLNSAYFTPDGVVKILVDYARYAMGD